MPSSNLHFLPLPPTTSFFNAAKNGDLFKLQECLEEGGCSIKSRHPETGLTAKQIAEKEGLTETVRFLDRRSLAL